MKMSAFSIFTDTGFVHSQGAALNATLTLAMGAVTVRGRVVGVYPCDGSPFAAQVEVYIRGVKGIDPREPAMARAVVPCDVGPGDDLLLYFASLGKLSTSDFFQPKTPCGDAFAFLRIK